MTDAGLLPIDWYTVTMH